MQRRRAALQNFCSGQGFHAADSQSSAVPYRAYANWKKHLLHKQSFVVFTFFFAGIVAPERGRWLAETHHVTSVGRPAVSCPLKSSVRGRPQHQTLVSVPPSQFWYIVADERKEGEKFPLLFVLKIFLTAQHHPFLFVQHVVYNTVHTSSSLISLGFSSILSSIYTSSCFPNSVSLLNSWSLIRWQVVEIIFCIAIGGISHMFLFSLAVVSFGIQSRV